MDLRAKTFLIIGLTLLGGIALIVLFSFTLLTESYSRFEEDNTRQNVINGLKVLSNEKDQIYSLTGDWSRWDETYLFVQDKNENYIIKNLNYASISNLGVDLLIFFREDNSLKYATQINTTAGHMESVSDRVVSQVAAIPGFFSFESILDGKSGYILLPDGPAIITSQPIITSTYQGPSVGTLIFVKYLDNSTIQTLSGISGLQLSLTPVISIPLKTPASHIRDNTDSDIIVTPESDMNITGTTYLPTIDSKGFLEFTVRLPRDIIRQGTETIVIYIIILMILGLVIIGVSLLIIDRLVLIRLRTLIVNIKKRNTERTTMQGPLLNGNDEFSRLAQEIHPIFSELNRSRMELEEHNRLLVESERKYRELADLLPEFVFESDLDGNISFINQMGKNISGYSTEEATSGLHILTFFHPDNHAEFRSALEEIRQGRSITGYEFTGMKRNGELYPVVVYASPIWQESRVIGLRGFAIDISERKEIETSLRKLAEIVEHTSTGIVTGTGPVVDYVNAAYSRMHGADPAVFIGKSPFVVGTVYPEKNFLQYLESAMHSGHATFELDHIRSDNTLFPALHDLTILSGSSVENVVWVLNVQDITEQRLAWKALLDSEALRESARQLRDVISRLPDATFVIDKDGWVIFWNQAMEQLTGIPEEKIIGRGRYEYANPFYGEKRPMLLNAVLDKEGTIIQLFPNVSRSGDSLFTDESFPQMGKGGKYFSSMAGPIYDSKGNIIGAIQSMRDITARIMAEKALMRTNEKLNLLSSITRHDIRNRVTVILGLLPLLKEARDDPETAEIVKILDNATRLIHDQIEFTRVYQNLGIQSPEWKDTGSLVQKASEIGIPDRITVENHLSGLFIYADPLLERVFYNLIDNAIRHGGPNLSRIRFSWHPDDSAACIVCEDDGQGVPDDLKERIFERGYGSNTGLGLFLVREILSITGMSIIETGVYGKGARFEIRIPSGGYTEKNRNQ